MANNNCTYRFSTASGPVEIKGMAAMKAFLAVNGVEAITGAAPAFSQKQTEKPLTEKQFYRTYYQHRMLRGPDDVAAIMRDGWQEGGIGPNVLPAYQGGQPSNILERKYMLRAGDTALLIPKDGVRDTTNGPKVKAGWKPRPYEIVQITSDGQAMYPAYLQQFKAWQESQEEMPSFSARQRAFHGTPYRGIDKFSTEAIGTGEGAQAFGWGLYFAGKREIAEYYRRALTSGDVVIDGSPVQSGLVYRTAMNAYKRGIPVNKDSLLDFIEEEVASAAEKGNAYLADMFRRTAEQIRQAQTISMGKSSGQLYEVEIPHDSEMLLWDKPLTEQPKGFDAAIRKAAERDADSELRDRVEPEIRSSMPTAEIDENDFMSMFSDANVEQNAEAERLIEEAIKSHPDRPALVDKYTAMITKPDRDGLRTGKSFYKQISSTLGGDRQASEFLYDIGIKGIKYQAEQLSGGRGDSFNYVIFSGDDIDIQQTFYSKRQTDTPEFKRWFGDSKVVDDQGRPIVVYHGTTKDFFAFDPEKRGQSTWHATAQLGDYFSADPDMATEFIPVVKDREKPFSYRVSDGGNVMPVYLSIKNPYEMHVDEFMSLINRNSAQEVKDLKANLIEQGHDGLHVRGDKRLLDNQGLAELSADTWVAFRPEQIKSATGNTGNFDPTNPDIRFSRRQTAIPGSRFTLPSVGQIENARIKLQDDALRMKRVVDAVKQQGGTVGEAQNFYDALTLMPGRIQAAVDDFKNDVVRPMLDKAAEYDIDLDELALYAYAKHAPERNAYIASINPRFPDGGSGMTNADANKILADVRAAGKQREYDDLHKDLMAITATTRQVMLNEGLITQDEFDAMDSAYQNYIPLRGFENVDEETGAVRPGLGRGVNVRGKETIRALGRASRAGDLIENALRDYERVVARVEKNDVGKVLLDFVLSNPDPDLWGVDIQRSKPSFNKARGIVQYTKTIEKGEDTIGVKVGGQQVYVQLNDPVLTRALRQAWRDETSGLERATLAMTGWWNNWMRAVLTKYNPAFAAINIPRDALWSGAASALADIGGKGLARYLAVYPKAFMASARKEAGVSGTTNKLFGNPQMDRRFTEFRAAGGITGGFYMKSLDDINQDLRNELLLAGASPRNFWETVKALPPFKLAKLTLRLLEFMGAASENATRFALYEAAREVGRSPAQAAILAKDGTTNFNRRGEWGGALNNLYLFFNAGVQGTTQLAKVLKSPAVQASMAGVTGVGMLLALYGASAGGEDDDGEAYWDKIPSYVKERNLVIMLPPGEALAGGIERVGQRGRYLTIPVQYGFNIFPNLGYVMADSWRNLRDPKRGLTPTKAALHMTSLVFGSVNPFGGAVDVSDGVQVLLAAMPTLADLPIQLINERNTFGTPSAPPKSPFDKRPDSERMFTSQQGTVPAKIAKTLNELGGGNEAKAGSILGMETSVAPGTIQTLISATTGGLGNFVEQVSTSLLAAQGEGDVKANKLPILNRFYGEVDESANIRTAAERMAEVRKLSDEVKAQLKLGIDPEIKDEEEKLLTLAGMQEAYQRQQLALRKAELQIIKDPALTEAQKKLERRQLEVERDKLATDVNREYLKVTK